MMRLQAIIVNKENEPTVLHSQKGTTDLQTDWRADELTNGHTLRNMQGHIWFQNWFSTDGPIDRQTTNLIEMGGPNWLHRERHSDGQYPLLVLPRRD